MSDNLPAVAGDIHFEVALDSEPELAPALPVDDLPVLTGTLLPVVPEHLQTVAGVKAAVARQAGLHWHRARYHGLRSPRYLLLVVVFALAGLVKVTARQLHWWHLLEQHGLRSQAAAAGDSREWMKLHKEAKETRKIRGYVLLAQVALIVAVIVLLVHFGRWWAWAGLLLVVVPLLAHHGRPADKPIVSAAVVTPRFRKLSADIVLRAYYAAKLGDPVKPDQQVTFGSTMRRDGEGSRVLVDLPYGRSLKDAMLVKDAIASGLDVTESQVYLHRDPTSARRHTLWVADRDPLAVPVGRTPLLACKATDIWRPAPIGLDERGQLVTVPVLWNSVLVGALPRAGKTFSARLLALYCALDPYVKLDTFDFKGSPDWRRFALVADSSAFGLTPTRDGLPLEIFADTLNGIKKDVQDRYQRLSELPPEVCPEGKLTREIARDPRYNMPVRVLVLDEFQEVFDLGEPSKEIAQLLVFPLKVAPGAGVSVIGATQKPSGIGTGKVAQDFTSFRDNFGIRFGLRTSSWQVSEMVLGQGAYSEGLDTSLLLPNYKGVGILRGASDASPTVRTYLADGQDAERILLAARQLRERAGTLSGMAAGLDVPKDDRDVLADVLQVFGTDPALHWPVLAERLNTRIPDRWTDTTGEAVSAECRARGVPSVDVKQFGTVRKGCRRADVAQAAGQL